MVIVVVGDLEAEVGVHCAGKYTLFGPTVQIPLIILIVVHDTYDFSEIDSNLPGNVFEPEWYFPILVRVIKPVLILCHP